MQRICAILSLDGQTKDKIQGYRDTLTVSHDIPKRVLYPHITIAHYIGVDLKEIIRYSEAFIKEVYAFNIQYSSIEVLEDNCIACIVNPNSKVTELYNNYHIEYDNYCDIWTKKENKLWIPHSTIYGNSDSKLVDMKRYLESSFVPFEGKVIGFELSLINEDGYEIIFAKNLK